MDQAAGNDNEWTRQQHQQQCSDTNLFSLNWEDFYGKSIFLLEFQTSLLMAIITGSCFRPTDHN